MKNLILTLLLAPMLLWAQDGEIRKALDIPFPNKVTCASNEVGWTACMTEGPEDAQLQVFGEDWELLYSETWKSHYGAEFEYRLGEKDRYFFHDKSRFGFIHMQPDQLLRCYIIDVEKGERRKLEFNVFPEKKKRLKVEIIGQYAQDSVFGVIWIEKDGSIHHTSLNLDGEVRYDSFDNDQVKLENWVRYYIHFVRSGNRLPSDPFKGIGDGRLYVRGDTIWLLSNIRVKKASFKESFWGRPLFLPKDPIPENQLLVIALNTRTKEVEAGYFPLRGKHYVNGNSLWNLDVEQGELFTARFNIKKYRLSDIVTTASEIKPVYDTIITRNQPLGFPLPYYSLEKVRYSKKYDSYAYDQSIKESQRNSTLEICGKIDKAFSFQFLLAFDYEERLQQIHIGSIHDPMNSPNSVVTRQPGNWMWVMKLCFDEKKGAFIKPDSLKSSRWEHMQQIKKAVKESTGKVIRASSTFGHPDGWHLTYYDRKSRELVFKKL